MYSSSPQMAPSSNQLLMPKDQKLFLNPTQATCWVQLQNLASVCFSALYCAAHLGAGHQAPLNWSSTGASTMSPLPSGASGIYAQHRCDCDRNSAIEILPSLTFPITSGHEVLKHDIILSETIHDSQSRKAYSQSLSCHLVSAFSLYLALTELIRCECLLTV